MKATQKTTRAVNLAGAGARGETKESAFPVLLDQESAAEMLAVSPLTLQRWRACRPPVGPAFVRVGRRAVRYRLPDLLEYLDARLVPGSGPAKGETA